MINEKLKQEGTLLKFEELMNEVFARREGQLPPVPCVHIMRIEGRG